LNRSIQLGDQQTSSLHCFRPNRPCPSYFVYSALPSNVPHRLRGEYARPSAAPAKQSPSMSTHAACCCAPLSGPLTLPHPSSYPSLTFALIVCAAKSLPSGGASSDVNKVWHVCQASSCSRQLQSHCRSAVGKNATGALRSSLSLLTTASAFTAAGARKEVPALLAKAT
jgi:hypothetical protein